MNLDTSPDDAAEDAALRDGSARFAQECRDGSGILLDHLTTIDVVRDLDLLRHLLGAEKLNYVGVSYGTYVGSMYATLFPHSTGRLVLDAAVEITGKDEVPQAAGFELALSNFTTWCASSDLCELGDDKAAIDKEIATFLASLDAAPVTVGNRLLTQSLAASGVALFLYADEEAYRSLATVLQQAMRGEGANLLGAADSLNGRYDNGYDTIAYSFPAMACVDGVDEGVAPVLQDWKDTFDEAPILAPNMGTSYTCQLWTAGSAPQLKLDGAGAAPILVVGTTGDSATPYQQAVSMAGQLESGNLLTLDGAGHGAVTGDNECIAKAVERYLYDGVVPDEGTTCS
ncbi:alpha/beta hydrolase [Tessaracoccus sp. HDW20]|uniref:alpha/beta hydrolase n=1 Tax=Tessaracoccus coleopterorum TaxID=2714950 RepID=UPI0018D435AA|nr:alpha/beta hydrolase [Tessaracoccus coleopterorum]NHB85435.1 alpha/beta hydrolase [Tessaracoccus coleopterorum]